MDQNLDTYNEYVHEYIDYALGASEREIIRLFRNTWCRTRMLDIGIGTGRSTFTFAAIAKNYVGIDYAEEMLQQCREVLPEENHVVYEHCDARDLSRYYDAPFDFVLFSLNGIDSVGHEDRERILVEVRKVLSPGGHFCFSSHSVDRFSTQRPLPRFRLIRPIRSSYYLLQGLFFNWRLAREFRGRSIGDIRSTDWSVLKTGDHDFKIDIYHVQPSRQVAELERLGYEVVMVIDRHGRKIDPEAESDEWLYYICRHASQG